MGTLSKHVSKVGHKKCLLSERWKVDQPNTVIQLGKVPSSGSPNTSADGTSLSFTEVGQIALGMGTILLAQKKNLLMAKRGVGA